MSDKDQKQPDPRVHFTHPVFKNTPKSSGKHAPGFPTAKELGLSDDAADGQVPPAATKKIPRDALSERYKRRRAEGGAQ